MQNSESIMKKICLLAFISVCTFTGCTIDFWRDAISSDHSSVYDAMFVDSVNEDIKRELQGTSVKMGWHNYWIERCEDVLFEKNDKIMIQYIIDQRRKAGLADIPELESRWQLFTGMVGIQIDKEKNNISPPYTTDGKTPTTTWPDFWKSIDKIALQDAAISTNGIEYIDDHRKQAGLPPLK
jgi:hypothetical protein